MTYRSINQKIPRKFAGLSLIEMMLVITVIAVATLSTIKIIKNRSSLTVINAVAAQMENVAQSVVSYYMLENKWPTQSTTSSSLQCLAGGNISGCPTGMPALINTSALCTPFPSNNSSSQVCKNVQEIQGQAVTYATYYNITLVTDSNATALAIAGKLANATASGNTVTMSITPPAQYVNANGGFTNPNQGWIVSAGLISATVFAGQDNDNNISATPVVLPNCGPAFEGHIMFAPQRYETYLAAAKKPWGIHVLLSDPADASSKDSHGNEIYYTQLADEPDSKGSSVQHLEYYMTFCLPVGHWGTNFVDNTWLQDGQCSVSWVTFMQTTNSSYSTCTNTTPPNTSTSSSKYTPGTWNQSPIVGSPIGY